MSLLVDRSTAEAIQLRLEYNPAPPFNSGSPDTAPPEILALMKERSRPGSAAARRLTAPRRGWRKSGGVRRILAQKKKAAWFPRRPFLSYGSPH